MRILFSGQFPIWLAALVFVILVGLTVRLHWRLNLPGGWKYVVPGLRICVYAVLTGALLQPVISRQWRHIVRGKIAVVLDDSGSMGITDTYSPAEKVKTAWKLGLFPKDGRCSAFETAVGRADTFNDEMTALMTGLEKIRIALADKGKSDREIPQRLRRQIEGVDSLASAIRRLGGELREAVDATGYLSEDGIAAMMAGKVLYERFDDIDGRDVDQLVQSDKYPDRPDASAMLGAFEAPVDIGERYGARMRAVLSPPISGEYQFFISADDQAALFFSEDVKGTDPRRVAVVKEWVGRRTVKRPEQTSAPVTLDKDKRYYVEALFKEQGGGDHCAVGWRRPDGREETPIPGMYLSSVAGTVEQAKFKEAFGVFMNDLDLTLRRVELSGEELAKTTTMPSNQLPAALAAVSGELTLPRKTFRDTLVPRLEQVQRQADDVLAAAGVDGVQAGLDKLAGMTRFDLAVHLLEKGALKISTLRKYGDVDLFLMNEPPRPVSLNSLKKGRVTPARDATRLGSVVYDVLMSYGNQPVSAVIVLTDGNNNAGRDLSESAQVFQARDIPLLGVGIGLSAPPDDISVDSVSAPVTSFKGDYLVLTAVIRRHGYARRPIRLRVSSGNDTLHEDVLPPGEEEVVSVDLSFVEARDGFRHYVVEAEPMGGEVLVNNNRKSVSVNVLTDPVRALVIDQFPRWETRYAKMMLERDTRVEVRTFFTGNTGSGLERPMPEALFSREELFALDILVFGDVPAREFTPEELANIRAFVVERGGCLLLLAGPNHMPRAYRQTAIEEVFPFKIIPEPAGVTDHAKQSKAVRSLVLTESGKRAPPVRLAVSSKDNEFVWEQLPPLTWLADGAHPAVNADVLVTTAADDTPVVIMSQAGLGRVLFLGTDAFWRWRRGAGGRFHHRLWGQVFLWATVGRTTGMDEHVKLMTERAEYSPGEAVVLKARVLGPDKLPLENGAVTVDIVNSQGETVKRVRFTYLEHSGGEYRAWARDLPEGEYTAVPSVLELAGVELSADYPFEIKHVPTSEYVELALNTPALSVLTQEAVHFLDAENVLAKIPDVSLTETRREDIEIWDTGWLLLLVTVLLGAEWHIRKKLALL
ncbi:MAG: PA14 domain-containing protein [Lentisphaeria bacterium]|nr:PA14 domain-containing protein [Lentisphaeria bacterium]